MPASAATEQDSHHVDGELIEQARWQTPPDDRRPYQAPIMTTGGAPSLADGRFDPLEPP